MAIRPGDALARLAARAKQAGETLKAEYEAGKRGDEGPTAQLWAAPAEQLAAFVALLGSVRSGQASPGATASAVPEPPADAAATLDAEAAEVNRLLGAVDWDRAREAAGARSADAVQAVKAMAAQVDWAKVQPVAAQASNALIAAMASGQLPVGGRTGALLARAMLDEGGLGDRVGRQLVTQLPVRPDLRTAINVVDQIVKR